MYLATLSLENFRNAEKRTFRFSHNTTLLVGDNGVGKTNVLEALALLATGRSFRAQKVDEMIMYDKELARVVGRVADRRMSNTEVWNTADGTENLVPQHLQKLSAAGETFKDLTELQVTLTRGELGGKRVLRRRFAVDGASKRFSDFVGRLVVVVFRPEDFELVLGSPHVRRDFLDAVLVQVDREYRRSLMTYEKALSRRNRLLDAIREEGATRTQLTFWDQLLIKHGQVLTAKRTAFVESINRYEAGIDSFRVIYDSSVISTARLKKYAEQEVAVGYTLVGPHKDDLSLQFAGGRELALYGSRGEQRLAVLWLKLAELFFVATSIRDHPILLLDDIFSELDRNHREKVLDVIPKQQTIITTTDLHLIESKYRTQFEVVSLGST